MQEKLKEYEIECDKIWNSLDAGRKIFILKVRDIDRQEARQYRHITFIAQQLIETSKWDIRRRDGLINSIKKLFKQFDIKLGLKEYKLDNVHGENGIVMEKGKVKK